MNIRTRLRPGVYWDEHNIERRCVIFEINGRRATVWDAATRERIPDPPSAIPITTRES